jgi:hypothetical protein
VGTLGTSIFADDFAADIRSEWREAIEDGVDPAVATARLVARYGEPTSEPDEDAGFWIALAAAQVQTGRLQPEVKARAVQVIDAGGDLGRWADAGSAQIARRTRTLAGLRAAILGDQPLPTVLRRPKPIASPAGPGDLIAIRGKGGHGREAYFIVIGTADAWPRGSTAPELVGLDWDKSRRPSVAEARAAPLIRSIRDQRSLIEVYHVQGPSRGPNAFSKVASVIASGIERPDAPTPTERVQIYTLWRNLARMVDAEGFPSARGVVQAERDA